MLTCDLRQHDGHRVRGRRSDRQRPLSGGDAEDLHHEHGLRCGGDGGQCVKFFGPPLPLSAEGTPTCITTYFQEDISGTADTATRCGRS